MTTPAQLLSARTLRAKEIAGSALLRLGFRPFYLAAASAAVVLILLWPAVYAERVALANGLATVWWHAHEMIFGFVVAVVVGFLLTAGRTWTGLPTPRGVHLGALVLLWFAGRLASVFAPYPIYFLLDLMFLPIVATLFIDLLVRAGNLRNLPIAGVLVALSLVNLAFHLGVSQALELDPRRALHAALALLVLLVSIMAGRVIPMFTMNAVPGVKMNEEPWQRRLTMGLTAAGLFGWIAELDAVPSALLLATAAIAQVLRLVSWSPWATLGRPILWILHLGYAWVPVGLLMLAASRIGLIGVSAGVHAFAVGAMGCLIVGMMTRTARGHTGRPLEASRLEVMAYGAVAFAAALRVLAAVAPADVQVPTLIVAGGLWIGAFALYLLRFARWLTMPRLDGKDG